MRNCPRVTHSQCDVLVLYIRYRERERERERETEEREDGRAEKAGQKETEGDS